MTSVTSTAGETGTASGLRRGAVGPLDVFAQSLAATGPSIAIGGTPAVVFLVAGNGTVYSFIAGTAIVLLVGYSVAQFARRAAGAGSLYSYTAAGLGRLPGFAAAWGLVIGYAGIAAATIAGAALYAGAFLGQIGVHGGTRGIELVLVVVAALIAVITPVRGIRLSARAGIVIEVISLAAIVAVLIATLAHFGFGAGSVQFSAKGSGTSGIALGTVLAVAAFVGFESAGSLGFEARDPYRSIPRSVISMVMVTGVLYVVSSYIQVIGFDKTGGNLAQSSAPLNDVARIAGVGWLSYVLDVVIAVASVACASASLNAAARIVYNLAREGILAAPLGRAHPRFQTPAIAIVILAPIAAIVPFVLVAAGTQMLIIFSDVAVIATFGYLLSYLLVAIASPVYLRRLGSVRVADIVISTVTVVAIGYVIYKNLVPAPPWPALILPYVFAGLMLAGLGWYVFLRARHPQRAVQLGTAVETAG